MIEMYKQRERHMTNVFNQIAVLMNILFLGTQSSIVYKKLSS